MLPTTSAFTALMFIGLVGSTLMLIASIFSPVQRNPVWYTFTLSWIVYCSIYLMLWFAGESDNPTPPLKLATAQSAVAAAVPTFVASSSLTFVIEAYLSIRHILLGYDSTSKKRLVVGVSLTIAPWIVFAMVLVETLAFNYSQMAQKNLHCIFGLCALIDPIPGRITSVVVIMCIVPTVVFNFLIFRMLKRHSPTGASKKRAVTRILFLRISLFCVFGSLIAFANIALFIVVFFNHESVGPRMLLAIYPVGVVLIFGSHTDLLRVFMPWKKAQTASLPSRRISVHIARDTITTTSLELADSINAARSEQLENDAFGPRGSDDSIKNGLGPAMFEDQRCSSLDIDAVEGVERLLNTPTGRRKSFQTPPLTPLAPVRLGSFDLERGVNGRTTRSPTGRVGFAEKTDKL